MSSIELAIEFFSGTPSLFIPRFWARSEVVSWPRELLGGL
jgi:hypothetical protein